MSISVLLQQIAIIFLEIAVGFVAAKLKIITDRDSKFLSNLVMKIALPATMLASANVEAGREMVPKLLMGFVLLEGLYLAGMFICFLIARVMKLSRGKLAVLIGTGVMPNSAFIGIPLCTALLGGTLGAVYGASSIMAYNILFFTYIATLFQPGKKPDIKSFITPTNICTLIMVLMLLFGIRLPGPLQSFASAIGGCTTPLALMIVGVMLAGSNILELLKRPMLYLISSLRCVIFPLLFILVLWLLPLDRTMCMAMSIFAACPAGSLAAVMAKQNDVEGTLAGQAVAQSTLFMILTAPIVLGIAGKAFGI